MLFQLLHRSTLCAAAIVVILSRVPLIRFSEGSLGGRLTSRRHAAHKRNLIHHVPGRNRPGKPEDVEICARICYEAFTSIARQHNFPPDFPVPEAALGLLSMMLDNAKFYSVIGRIQRPNRGQQLPR
jgi:hypothetical protein